MKNLLMIFFLFSSSNYCFSQTLDYRDSVAGYYDCVRTDTQFFVDTTYGVANIIITKIGTDSIINFQDITWGDQNRNCHLKPGYYFYTPDASDFSGIYYSDSLEAHLFYTQGPNQPIAIDYKCYKTGPLSIDEDTYNSKILIGQSSGFINIIQTNILYADRVTVYSIDGKEILNSPLYINNNNVNSAHILPGIYLLAFFKANKFIDSKKVIIAN
jgi:hypothetical protein